MRFILSIVNTIVMIRYMRNFSDSDPKNLGEGNLPSFWVELFQTLRFVPKSQRNGRDEGRVSRADPVAWRSTGDYTAS